MKGNRLFKILAVAVVLALLMVAVPVTTVSGATGGISITSPAAKTGPVGTTVTLNCAGFTASQTYTVSFAGTSVTTGSTGGTGAFTATFTVPERARGAYNVTVTSTAPDDSNIEVFTITPEVLLDDTTGNVGDAITLDGTGFSASTTVTIYYDSTSVGTVTTDTYGSFDDFSLTVPASVKGGHDVKGKDATGYSPAVTFTVSPEITLNTSSGSVGDTVSVTGTGFAASKSVDITFDTSTVASTTTNSSGSFTATTFTVPSTSRGSHTVKARDASSNQATATFNVAASISLNPATGSAGTSVTVTGNGFAASSAITITYNSINVPTNPVSPTTNSAGYFTASFSVPAGLAGTYVVQASDGTNTVTANFTSTTNATISQTTSAASPGYVGMELTITGQGFSPSQTATVKYDGTETLTTVPINTNGSFEAAFTIPPSLGGNHTITVSDGLVTKEFTFVMEETAPPTPVITLPLADTKLKDGLFDWEASVDADGSDPVTYDLQVSIDDTFVTESVLLYKVGLTTTDYTLLEEEKLESVDKETPYYWRVRAVDAASNASGWSTPTPFTVGWSFEFTGWVVWVTMVVVAIAFFFLGLWIGRRGGGGGYY
jgi:hypothetical protein